jgi:hypothetical protein
MPALHALGGVEEVLVAVDIAWLNFKQQACLQACSAVLSWSVVWVEVADTTWSLIQSHHRLLQGYRPCDVPQEVVEEIAFVVEAKAFTTVVSNSSACMTAATCIYWQPWPPLPSQQQAAR